MRSMANSYRDTTGGGGGFFLPCYANIIPVVLFLVNTVFTSMGRHDQSMWETHSTLSIMPALSF